MERLVSGRPHHLLQELKDFTAQCRNRLSQLLQELGWEQEAAGGEQAVVYDPQFFYEKAKVTSVIIDKSKQYQIIKDAWNNAPAVSEDKSWDKCNYSTSAAEVPLNHKRAICDLTAADRLAIYDHVLLETKKQTTVEEKSASDLFEDLTAKINQDDEQRCPKSHLEIIAEMRDYKRRRQSYRAKNVHITKKSYTEIMRDVINVHMEELSSKWHDEVRDDASSSISSSSVKRRERSRSTESRQSGESHRDRHRSGRRREHSSSPGRRRSRGRDSRHKKDRDRDKHHGYKREKE